MIRLRAHRFAALPVLVVLLVGCAAPGTLPASKPPAIQSQPVPARSGTASPPVTAAMCAPDGVRFEVDEGNAAMGLRVLGITLINCGSRAYRLNGYPAVRSLDENRVALSVRVLHGVTKVIGSATPWDRPPEPIVLQPGQRAGTAVAWRNTYDDIRQPPVTVKFLDIAALAGRPSQIIDPDGGLDLGNTGRIGVSAWRLLPDTDATASPSGPPIPGASTPEVTEPAAHLP